MTLVLSLQTEQYFQYNEDNCYHGEEADGKKVRSLVFGLRPGDDSSTLGAAVGVSPEAREAFDQTAQETGTAKAADDGECPARGGGLSGDFCCHLTEAAPAGNQLSHVGELVRELAILPLIIDLSHYLDSVVLRSLLLLYV